MAGIKRLKDEERTKGIAWFIPTKESEKLGMDYIPHCCSPNWLCQECADRWKWVKTSKGFGSGVKNGKVRPCEMCGYPDCY